MFTASGLVLGLGYSNKDEADSCFHGVIISMSKGFLFVCYCFVFVFPIISCRIGYRN